ncbi:uncharacterized protein LOC101453835 [Ceratitis capitata]|uniref:uncharacterized protein LOC101453835 n=1 Tax=Ceratitis capitata TaxID=7213 RepID=UPI00032A2257|nr:uncharacterized protein LOC101453835 [Ceratitis capitata]
MFAKHLLKAGRTLRSNSLPVLHSAPLRHASKSPFVDGGPHSTMNDLPIPEGDWQEAYSRRNFKNTLVLLIGIGSFVTSIYMHFTDEAFNWNYKVPDYDRCS